MTEDNKCDKHSWVSIDTLPPHVYCGKCELDHDDYIAANQLNAANSKLCVHCNKNPAPGIRTVCTQCLLTAVHTPSFESSWKEDFDRREAAERERYRGL